MEKQIALEPEYIRILNYDYFHCINTLDKLLDKTATDQLMSELGFTRDLQQPLTSPIYEISVARLMWLAKRRFELPQLSAQLSQNLSLSSFGLLGHALLTVETVGKLLSRLVQYNSQARGCKKNSIVSDNKHTYFQFALQKVPPPYSDIYLEMWVARVWHVLSIIHPELSVDGLIQVNLSYSEPADKTVYQNFYPVPVYFDQPISALVFDNQVLDVPLSTANELVNEYLSQQINSVLDSLQQQGGVVHAVRQELMRSRRGSWTNLELIAQQLGYSGRSLRRHLLEQGYSFKQISNELRMTLAREYILSSGLTNEETAYMLGYSQPPAFYRAFQKWYGITPKQLRQQKTNT